MMVVCTTTVYSTQSSLCSAVKAAIGTKLSFMSLFCILCCSLKARKFKQYVYRLFLVNCYLLHAFVSPKNHRDYSPEKVIISVNCIIVSTWDIHREIFQQPNHEKLKIERSQKVGNFKIKLCFGLSLLRFIITKSISSSVTNDKSSTAEDL